ncbi:MAG: hypothetical protein ACLGGX_03145, partial [Bdellovibrionia bacterium]
LAPDISLKESEVVAERSQLRSGQHMFVHLYLRDSEGYPILDNRLNISFFISEGTSTGNFGPVLYHGRGDYSIQFTAEKMGTPIKFNAKINGKVLSSKILTQVVGGVPSAENSDVLVESGVIVEGNRIEGIIILRDVHYNPAIRTNSRVFLSMVGGTSQGTFTEVEVLQNNSIYFKYAANKRGSPTFIKVTIDGEEVILDRQLFQVISP